MMLLEIENLRTYFHTEDGVAKAVDGLNLKLEAGKTLCLVGESGSGKSVTALSIMKLIQSPPGKIESGSIKFNGENILELSDKELRNIRGNQISMIFQEPMTSLNPVFTCGNQIIEVIKLHNKLNRNEAKSKAIEMLEIVGIPDPEQRYNEYPHQLSGGMRQRVMIAIALSCNPALLIADEPTTALDVTVQAQILELLKNMQIKFNMGVILITHDLGVVAEVADDVAVMYAGEIVEYTDVKNLFANPLHPYTKALMKSIPRIDDTKEFLDVIPGSTPDPANLPKGCRFHDRCEKCEEKCTTGNFELTEIQNNHLVRCWKAER